MENDIPQRNLDDPNTKGTQSVKFDLFDFNGETPKRISLDMAYDPDDPAMNMPPDGLKVSITTGDNAASSTITIPVWFLTRAMGELLAAHKKQKDTGLVGFDKPSIIGLN